MFGEGYPEKGRTPGAARKYRQRSRNTFEKCLNMPATVPAAPPASAVVTSIPGPPKKAKKIAKPVVTTAAVENGGTPRKPRATSGQGNTLKGKAQDDEDDNTEHLAQKAPSMWPHPKPPKTVKRKRKPPRK
jgi:hypothetical protein